MFLSSDYLVSFSIVDPNFNDDNNAKSEKIERIEVP